MNRVASGRETLMRAGCERTEVKRVVGTRETFPEQRALECVENGKWFVTPCRRFPGGSVVKNMPAIQKAQEMRVQSLGQEDPPGEKSVCRSRSNS